MESDCELAYWAGFIDGEGGVIIGKNSREYELGARNDVYFLRVQVYNTDETIIRSLRDAFQLGTVFSFMSKRGSKSRLQWRWTASCNEACEVLEMLLPWLRLKKPQARLGIYFQRNKSNDQRGPLGLSKEEMDFREHCYLKMRSLNSLHTRRSNEGIQSENRKGLSSLLLLVS